MTTPAAKPDEASAVDPDVTDSGEQGMATHEASDLTKEDYEEIAREKLGFPKDPGAIDLEVFKECIASMPLAPLHDQAAKLVTEVEALRERVAELEQQQCAMPPTTAWRGKCGHDWRKDQAEECPICLANYYSMKYTEADDTASRYVRERNDAEALMAEMEGATELKRSWPEDFSHENGNYFCCCVHCGKQFRGHKRRVVCKLCTAGSVGERPGDGK